MGLKIIEKKTYVFKPEISHCPFCGARLVYRHTVSNKVIQFSSGVFIRVKNLGYHCPNEKCKHYGFIFTSFTASKLCIKGYTYSSKVLAMIYYYKVHHIGREKICDVLISKGLQISDRNIDLISKQMQKNVQKNYLESINEIYPKLMKEFGEIWLSIDFISVEDSIFVSVRDCFHSYQIGMHFFSSLEDKQLKVVLKKYFHPNYLITKVATVRKITKSFEVLKEVCSENIKFFHYIKM